MSDSLPDRLRRLLVDHLAVEATSADTDLFETGLLDSLQFVQLLTLLEQHFGVRFSLEDLEIDNFRSIGRIANFIDRHRTRLTADGASPLTGADARAQKP